MEDEEEWLELDETAEEIPDPGEMPVELPVHSRHSEMRLVSFVAQQLPNFSRKTVFRLLELGKVRVNGTPAVEDLVLQSGNVVTLRVRSRDTDPTRSPVSLDILHETPEFIVLNKPAGEVVVPERESDFCPLLEALRRHFEDAGESEAAPRIVHRLDRDTTGVLIVAKTLDAQRWLTSQFQEQQVEKKYLAVVEGEVQGEADRIELKIRPESKRSTKMITSATGGRDSVTRYQVAERFRSYTLLEVFPETGRTHQVRVHLAAIGYPLAADPMYGTQGELLLSQLKRGYRPAKDRPEPPVIARCSLHAASIRFRPSEGAATVQFEAPIPKDLDYLLRCLRKYRSVGRGGRDRVG